MKLQEALKKIMNEFCVDDCLPKEGIAIGLTLDEKTGEVTNQIFEEGKNCMDKVNKRQK